MNEQTFQTSREAYTWCLEQNVISQRVAEVLKVLVEADGSMNQTMAHTAVVTSTGNVMLQKYSVSPRFAVLQRMGLIRETEAAVCPISGRKTIFYEATCTSPKMTESEAMKVPSKKETMVRLKKELQEVTAERDQLRELVRLRSASHAAAEERMRRAPKQTQTLMFATAV